MREARETRRPGQAAAVLLALALGSCAVTERTGRDLHERDSGGVLSAEQAAYDVRHYDLALEVLPERRAIAGTLALTAEALAPLRWLVLDLDPLLHVEKVLDKRQIREVGFGHLGGVLMIDLGWEHPAGETIEVAITYGGAPRVASRPPWDGGFTWSRTPSGAPWIATSCQGEGADVWWPCKDHPSDKPDAFDLHITVPEGLFCASNGRLVRREVVEGGRETFHWSVSTPISNYCVALNIAPYVEEVEEYRSVAGEPLPITFYCLPESREKARAILPEFKDHLAFFERHFGPYAFRGDKYAVAETPHLGMEHQTIIAYGHQFRGHKYGFDWLHHHELSHEWFGNLVTAPDWNDFWIHEGFGSYTQKLYIEERNGIADYHRYLADVRGRILNAKPLAPREPRSSDEMYDSGRADRDGRPTGDSDMYFKGEWVLHTLRYLIGRDALLRSMRRLCYPEPSLESLTDGTPCHFATSADFQSIAEAEGGVDLDWFFAVYLRQPALPRLEHEVRGGTLSLRWAVPGDLPFPMPVEIAVGGERRRVELPDGAAAIAVPEGATIEIDPDRWLLREEAPG